MNFIFLQAVRSIKQVRAIAENEKQFKNAILKASKSKTPSKNARCLQYMSCIVLHYLVHQAFFCHHADVYEGLIRNKKDPKLVNPFIQNAPSGYGEEDHAGVPEPGKAEFFSITGLDVLAKGLLILGYSESKIRNGFREIDTIEETMQSEVNQLCTSVAIQASRLDEMEANVSNNSR